MMYKSLLRLFERVKPSFDKEILKGIFELLRYAYTERHRYYHNLTHIEACLKELEKVRSLCQSPDAVELAIIYHDVVYVPGSAVNEQASADRASYDMDRLNLSPVLKSSVCSMIKQTCHRGIGTDGDSRILLDIDMSILSKDKSEYIDYENGILREYEPIVTEENLVAGRLSFLMNLIELKAIYQTQYGLDNYEAKARANITKTIACFNKGDIGLSTWGI